MYMAAMQKGWKCWCWRAKWVLFVCSQINAFKKIFTRKWLSVRHRNFVFI